METAEGLRFSLTPEALRSGSAEERAAFGMVAVAANGSVLTEGISMGRSELQRGPYVSGYHLAEWLVWNWWRLRWEPPPTGAQPSWNWDLAHRMSSIGEGYVWPNIEIASDGLLVRFVSSPSTDPHAGAFRYVGAPRLETVSVEAFEEAVQRFVRIVIDLLDDRGIRDTNLHRLWRDLERESDEKSSPFRRIEAMLGHDPDEGNEAEIRAQLADVERLGRDAVAELAADAGHDERPVRADDVRKAARRAGFDAHVEDAAQLASTDDIPAWGACEAWRVGVAMAQALRAAAALNGQPVANAALCELAGTSERAIQEQSRTTDRLSFALDDGGGRSRIALRSKWETGRRFDLARLIADRLCQKDMGESLLPATQSFTYRQKAQRAFAAEFLAPIGAVDEFLGGDVSEEPQNDAAQHFKVSPLTIRSLLINNHRIGHEWAL